MRSLTSQLDYWLDRLSGHFATQPGCHSGYADVATTGNNARGSARHNTVGFTARKEAMEPIGIRVATALGSALVRPTARSAGQAIRDIVLGPRHLAALQKVYKRTVDIVTDSCLPVYAPREHREHVRWIVEQSIAAAVDADVLLDRSDTALGTLLSRLRDPGLAIDIDGLAALGVNIVELLAHFLGELPAQLEREALRSESPLFPLITLHRLEEMQERLRRVAYDVGSLPTATDEQDRIRVLSHQGWIRTLEALYPEHRLVNIFGHPAAACVFPAPADEWDNLEAALGDLQGDYLPDHDSWSHDFDPAAYPSFRKHLATARAKRKWNGPTFALHRISLVNGRVRIDCKPGRYFQSLATSEECDNELMVALSAQPDEPVDLVRLPRRRWIHEQAALQNPVIDGTGRAAAVSVATVVLIARQEGGYGLLLTPRSGEVATHKFFNHVAPSGIFSPLDLDLSPLSEEFSVRRTLLREYIEELFSNEEYEIGNKPVHDLETDPEVVRLNRLVSVGDAGVYYTGISVNLLTLRPEICTLLLVRDPNWIADEESAAERSGRPWKLAWEWLPRHDEHQLPPGRRHHYFLQLDDALQPKRLNDSTMAPTALIPNAAAAISLGLQVARKVLAR